MEFLIIGIFILFIILVYILVSYITFCYAFKRPEVDRPDEIKEGNRFYPYVEDLRKTYHFYKNMPYTKHEIKFENETIIAKLIKKEQVGRPKVILLSHGWKSSPYADLAVIGSFLDDLNVDLFLTYNYGHGESTGKFNSFGMKDHKIIEDWIVYINNLYNHNCDIYLYGMAMGGHAALLCANKNLENVLGIISDSAYTTTFDELKFILNERVFTGTFAVELIRLLVKFRYKLDIKRKNTLHRLSESKYKVLLFHGDEDKEVPYQMSLSNYEVCSSEKDICITHGADHIMSHLVNPKEYEFRVKNFINNN